MYTERKCFFSFAASSTEGSSGMQGTKGNSTIVQLLTTEHGEQSANIEQSAPPEVATLEYSEQGDEGVQEDSENVRKKRRPSIGTGAKGKQPAKRLKSTSS